ncbi:hypothetical protein, partial [Streptomyces sp. AK04-3B]|uniref:hypothetical protein n=1 Tax=Streptomyces sp. AK04-3B TaxID=3028650 RepID=UPI0029B15ACE
AATRGFAAALDAGRADAVLPVVRLLLGHDPDGTDETSEEAEGAEKTEEAGGAGAAGAAREPGDAEYSGVGA